MKDNIELLAPAGSLETLKAVVNAGADAVYCGGASFGARAYAKNFTTEEMIMGIDHCHLHGVRLYLTLNTLVKNRELPDIYDFLMPFYEAGLDGVLVQDMGVFSFIKKNFPKLPIHASTQMSVAGTGGAAYLKELGFKRVVLSRELSLEEIKGISQTVDIELESFVHGALCYSYSGMCLMSSMIGGRSGNRGRCAGTCRLPFKGKKGDIYPYSLKDVCTVELLPEIIEAGICSLKIEGRMKTTEYAAGVTSIYRKYIDMYLEKGSSGYSVSDGDMGRLTDLGSRSGFCQGYYKKHNDPDMVTLDTSAHTHAPESDLERLYGVYKKDKKIKLKGHLLFKKNAPVTLAVSLGDITVKGISFSPSEAEKRPIDREQLIEKIKKTGATEFEFEELNIDMDEGLFVPMPWINELRRNVLDDMKKKLLEGYKRTL